MEYVSILNAVRKPGEWTRWFEISWALRLYECEKDTRFQFKLWGKL